MKRSIILLLSVITLGSARADYFSAVKSDPAPLPGQSYYLRHCIWYEGKAHSTTNYTRGTLVPINSQVTIIRLDQGHLTYRITSSGVTLKEDNAPKFSRATYPDIAARMFSATPIALDALAPTTADDIRSGHLRLGMTKAEVVMARGYPPAHQTPSLDGETWKYWQNRFAVQTLVFTDGRLSAGRDLLPKN